MKVEPRRAILRASIPTPVTRLLPLVLFVIVAGACSQPPPELPHVRLASEAGLTALFPDSVGTYGAISDTTYRGYYVDSTRSEATGVLAVLSVERTYRSGGAIATMTLSSFDSPARYADVLVAGGGQLVPDSVVAGDSTLQTAYDAGWSVYVVPYGIVLADSVCNAVEARSTFPGFAQQVIPLMDLARLAAVPEEEVVVDSKFLRVAPPRPGDETPSSDSTAADSSLSDA